MSLAERQFMTSRMTPSASWRISTRPASHVGCTP